MPISWASRRRARLRRPPDRSRARSPCRASSAPAIPAPRAVSSGRRSAIARRPGATTWAGRRLRAGRRIGLTDVEQADGSSYTAAFAERLVGDGIEGHFAAWNYAVGGGPLPPRAASLVIAQGPTRPMARRRGLVVGLAGIPVDPLQPRPAPQRPAVLRGGRRTECLHGGLQRPRPGGESADARRLGQARRAHDRPPGVELPPSPPQPAPPSAAKSR